MILRVERQTTTNVVLCLQMQINAFTVCKSKEAIASNINPKILHMKNQITELWDLLVDNGLAAEQTLQVITSINGYTLETLNDVLYAITGCRCIEQYHAEGVQIDAIA